MSREFAAANKLAASGEGCEAVSTVTRHAQANAASQDA
jgi:hypothetical protein